MALVKCKRCKGHGQYLGVGAIRRKCDVCEGGGEVSDLSSRTPEKKSKSKKEEG